MSATNELLQEGRYRINTEFHHNGNGSVYDAYDTVRDTNVVVKEIPVKLNKVMTVSQQELLNLSFANQAKILTEINHEALLHVHDYFSEIGRQYLVMESVNGDDLRSLMEKASAPFPVSDAVAWADKILDALNYLHTFKPPIIHRNIRPENIKLTADGKVKLLAFGLADGSDTKISTTMSDETDAATLRYSPLEQIWEGLDAASQKVIASSYTERSARLLKEPADARSDIYSLGATLYNLITMVEPVDALERSIEVLDGKPDPLVSPSVLDAAIPQEVSDVLLKAMKIKREDRFDSVIIMRQVLRTALVRVKERLAEEAKGPSVEVSAEHAVPPIHNSLSPSFAETSAIHVSETDSIKELLRQAEERRAQAELRAAEVEKLLAEQRAAEEEKLRVESEIEEARRELAEKEAAVATALLSDEDLLDLLLPTEPAQSQAFEPLQSTSAEISFADVLPEMEEKVEMPQVFEAFAPQAEVLDDAYFPESEFLDEAETAEVSTSDAVIEPAYEYEPEVMAFGSHVADSDSFSQRMDTAKIEEYHQEIFSSAPSSGLPLKALAAGAGALIVLIFGVWMLMSGSPATETATPVQAVVTADPAPVEPQAVPVEQAVQVEPSPAAVQTETISAVVPAAETAPAQTETAAKPVVKPIAQKPVKPVATAAVPAKTPQPKKAVTVEDLLNN